MATVLGPDSNDIKAIAPPFVDSTHRRENSGVARAGKLRARKRRSGKSKKGTGLSLRAASLIAIGTFILIFTTGIFLAELFPLQHLQTLRTVAVEAQGRQLADGLALKLAEYTQGARAIARDPAIVALAKAGDRPGLARRARELGSLFPWALTVRFLPTGLHSPDKQARPPIGFACIDMMREAETRRAAPPVEVHVPGTPQQHVDIIQPVLDADGRQVLAHLQVVLKVEALNQWLRELAGKEGYVSLVQTVADRAGVQLAQLGDPNLRAEGRSAEIPVPGTRWKVNLWLSRHGEPGLLDTRILLVFVVGALMSFLLILLLWRSLSRAISYDLDNFMHMMAAELYGRKAHEYQLLLPEFREASRRIANLVEETNTMERERDDDATSLSLKELRIDEMDDSQIMDVSSVAVEELDDISAFEAAQAARRQSPPAPEPAQSSARPAAPATPPALPPEEIFKAYDIRGIVGHTLTAAHMEQIGKALGSEAISRGVHRIAFARDGRLSGPELGQALVKGILSTGVDVVDVGMVPTPLLYYAAAELTDGSGVMLTGSHNPPDYNGLKIVLDGESLSGDAIQALKERVYNEDFVTGQGQYETHPVSSKYVERVTSEIRLKRPLKIVVDCGNGVAGGIAPKLYRALGCEVVELYSEVDGRFPNHHPDPSQPENLKDLIEMVRTAGADLGFAFDGDGDRLGVVGPDGSIIWPDRLMMLFAADVLSRNPGAQIIYDIKCSNNLTAAIWERGGEPVMWKTGHSLIKTKMKQSGALLAGEMSGHIFFKERWYGFDDALYAGARLLEILAADERPVQEVFAALPDAVNTPELRVELPQAELGPFMDDLLAKADFPDANVTMIDGIRADFEYGWGLVRASNTTPSLILRFEGRDAESLEKVQEQFRALLLSIRPDLRLPF